MMKKLMTLTFCTIFLMIIISNLASAEVYLWNSVIKDETESLVKYHAFYWFDDTSGRGIGKQKDIPITLWYDVQSLPLNLTYGVVDWCNLTLKHYRNTYGTTFVAFQGFFGGELLNATTETQSYYFTASASDKIIINMRDKDSLTATMSCHYTDINSLFEYNILGGSFTTYMPSFECEGCTEYSLEELSNQIDRQKQITANELSIYDKIQTAIDWNFQIWLILSWIIKIGLILVALGLIFASVYYFYSFLTKIGETI